MKAMLPREKVLLYHLGGDSEKGKQLREELEKMKIPWREIVPSQLSLTVGELTGGTAPDGEYQGEEPPCELMVLCGFSGNRMDRFLNTLSSRKIGIELKAVLTARNREWTVLELIRELQKEKEQIEGNQT